MSDVCDSSARDGERGKWARCGAVVRRGRRSREVLEVCAHGRDSSARGVIEAIESGHVSRLVDAGCEQDLVERARSEQLDEHTLAYAEHFK